MYSDTIYSELINIGDTQNYTNDIIKKNSDKLDKISERVSREQEPPVVVVPDTVEIRNLPEVQKVEVINTEQTDLSTVEGLISELIDVLPSIKDEELAVSIVKLTEAIKQDQSKEKVVELLRAILDKESPSFEIPDELKSKEGRIKVEVDRVGSSIISTQELKYVVGMEIPAHNFISLAEDTLVDTWTYKVGGSGGITVAVVEITYTDSTKNTIYSITKS